MFVFSMCPLGASAVLRIFVGCCCGVVLPQATLDKLIEQRMKKRRFAHNSAYMILDVENKIKAAEHEIQDLQVAHDQELCKLNFQGRGVQTQINTAAGSDD